jgi:hypothetical protein
MSYTATHMSRRQGGNRGPVSNKEDVGTVILPRLLPKARTLHMLVEQPDNQHRDGPKKCLPGSTDIKRRETKPLAIIAREWVPNGKHRPTRPICGNLLVRLPEWAVSARHSIPACAMRRELFI